MSVVPVSEYKNYPVMTIRSRKTRLIQNVIFCGKLKPKEYLPVLQLRHETFLTLAHRRDIEYFITQGYKTREMETVLKELKHRRLPVDPLIMFTQVIEAINKVQPKEELITLLYDETGEG